VSARPSKVWLRALVWAGVLAVSGLAGQSALRELSLSWPLAMAQRIPDAGMVGSGGVGGSAAPVVIRPVSPKVKIVFQTVPILKNQKVEIRWGKKRLGFIDGARKPFILERMRDSGPIDVTVKAEGYLTVNTRAYTFDDNKVFVKLTPETEKHTLLGYRVQLPDAGVDGGAPGGDGGVPLGPYDVPAPPPMPAPGQPPLPAPPPAPAPPPVQGPALPPAAPAP
jgi:hypothetical protein